MSGGPTRALALLRVSLGLVVAPTAARAGEGAEATPAILAGVDVTEHLGAQLPRDLELRDMDGRPVTLGSALDGRRPVLLVMAYYRCPMLCGLVLRSVAANVASLSWRPGEEYRLLTVSFDPEDGPIQAAARQQSVLSSVPEVRAEAWPFWTAPGSSAERLLDGLGVRVRRDSTTGQWAHPAVFFVLTPDGRISRYLYGVAARPFDVRLALLEASRGEQRATVDRVLLRCFMYDPATRRYGLFVTQYFRVGAGLILLALAVGIGALLRQDLREREASDTAASRAGRGDR